LNTAVYCTVGPTSVCPGARIDAEGRLGWSDTGSLPIPRPARETRHDRFTSSDLLAALSYVKNRYDWEPERFSAADTPGVLTVGEAEV
jgi:methylaspartate mutase epsilon subunit